MRSSKKPVPQDSPKSSIVSSPSTLRPYPRAPTAQATSSKPLISAAMPSSTSTSVNPTVAPVNVPTKSSMESPTSHKCFDNSSAHDDSWITDNEDAGERFSDIDIDDPIELEEPSSPRQWSKARQPSPLSLPDSKRQRVEKLALTRTSPSPVPVALDRSSSSSSLIAGPGGSAINLLSKSKSAPRTKSSDSLIIDVIMKSTETKLLILSRVTPNKADASTSLSLAIPSTMALPPAAGPHTTEF